MLAACLWTASAASAPLTIFVAPNGNDNWSGSLDSNNATKTDGPLATLEKAVEKSRASRNQSLGADVRIVLRGGTYSLERPLKLAAEDSGLRIESYGHEVATVTSEVHLADWHRSSANPNLWETHVPDGWRFHELFVNGIRKNRARVPATGFFHCMGGPVSGQPKQLRFHPGDIKESWTNYGDVELVLLEAWAQSRNVISAVDAGANVVTLAGDAFPNNSEQDARYYIENAIDGLRVGAWRVHGKKGVVLYWPEAGEDVISETITAPRLNDLVQVVGEQKQPAHNIIFDNLIFAGADWPLKGGSDMDPQAAVEVEAALQFRFAKQCTVRRCRFSRFGGYAVDFGHGCQDNTVLSCEMSDLGGGGIRLGDSDMNAALVAPNGGNNVTDTHIHHIGLVHAPAVGVLALLTANNRISHNEIDHTYYTTVSVGWTWGYGPTPCRSNIVEYNHLHDIGQGMLSDMGGVYTLGLQPGTIIRNNVIHDVNVFNYGGWGLYTDEGSSGIVLESNIVYRCQSAGFHQHYGETNLLYNNIFALNQDHQLMRTREEPHVSFTFTNNIVYFNSGDLLGGNWAGTGLAIDHNIYFDTRTGPLAPALVDGSLKFDDWRKRGYDANSIFVDPMFAAPQNGDFRIKKDSPAIAFGFHPLE